MKRINITRGKVVLVSDCDFEWASKFSWQAYGKGDRWYARRREGWRGPTYAMHRELINPPPGFDVDHIDGDGLNNQRENLRILSRRQNLCAFTRKRKGATSAHLGVSFDRTAKKWIAQISLDGKNRYIGRYDTEEQAHKAYLSVRVERDASLGLTN